MKFSIDKQENYTIFSVSEPKLNSIIAPEIKTRLTVMSNEGDKYIIFDLSTIAFVDSAGLSAILVGHRLCDNADGLFVLASPSENVKRLITISQLSNVLTVTDTVEEAIARVGMEAFMDAIEDEDSLESDEGEEDISAGDDI